CFMAQWPVGVWRVSMRLQMDGDHLPALGQFGQVTAEAVGRYAPMQKNERLAGAMHAVKDMLAIDVGKIRIRHGGCPLGLNGKRRSQHCGRLGNLQEIASEHIVLTSRPVCQALPASNSSNCANCSGRASAEPASASSRAALVG